MSRSLTTTDDDTYHPIKSLAQEPIHTPSSLQHYTKRSKSSHNAVPGRIAMWPDARSRPRTSLSVHLRRCHYANGQADYEDSGRTVSRCWIGTDGRTDEPLELTGACRSALGGARHPRKMEARLEADYEGDRTHGDGFRGDGTGWEVHCQQTRFASSLTPDALIGISSHGSLQHGKDARSLCRFGTT